MLAVSQASEMTGIRVRNCSVLHYSMMPFLLEPEHCEYTDKFGIEKLRLTLQIKKENRKGKVLLDIFRNRQSQTIISAYSVRGLPGAPVSYLKYFRAPSSATVETNPTFF